jgi:hypothetical protein
MTLLAFWWRNKNIYIGEVLGQYLKIGHCSFRQYLIREGVWRCWKTIRGHKKRKLRPSGLAVLDMLFSAWIAHPTKIKRHIPDSGSHSKCQASDINADYHRYVLIAPVFHGECLQWTIVSSRFFEISLWEMFCSRLKTDLRSTIVV